MEDDIECHVVALYYIYTPRPIPGDSISSHMECHRSLCTDLGLNGRVRVSSEGINGVLSGRRSALKVYEESLKKDLVRVLDFDGSTETEIDLDVKYCQLRRDIPAKDQLFSSLSVKETREVVSLYESKNVKKDNRNRGKGRRRRQKCSPSKSDGQSGNPPSLGPTSPDDLDLDRYPPATHLTPQQWNAHLSGLAMNGGSDDVVLIDARNIYESRVGHMAVPGVSTLLPNTRKFSSFPLAIDAASKQLSGKKVYMYCTGGVRCERASAYLKAVSDSDRWKGDKPKEIYQLKGGIQRYLETYGTLEGAGDENTLEATSASLDTKEPVVNANNCLYKGRNFVFDQRRTDPLVGPDGPGRCLRCGVPHDDYDNGHAPCEYLEARCCRCRVLLLVCNTCRRNVRSFGEDGAGQSNSDLLCGPGGKECVDEGNVISVEVFVGSTAEVNEEKSTST